MYPWSSWRTLVPLLLGIFGLCGFAIYSALYSPKPLIRRTLFASATAKSAYFATTMVGVIIWGVLYYLPLYFQVAKNYSPTSSGLGLLPLTVSASPAAVMVGILITKTGRYRPSIVRIRHLHIFIYFKSSLLVNLTIFMLTICPSHNSGLAGS